jgi:hypothetical protein
MGQEVGHIGGGTEPMVLGLRGVDASAQSKPENIKMDAYSVQCYMYIVATF